MCVNSFVCVRTLVSKGWDRQWWEQRLPVPEVRSAHQHDALPFNRTPAARTQNGLIAPAAPPTPPTAVVDIYSQNAPSVCLKISPLCREVALASGLNG